MSVNLKKNQAAILDAWKKVTENEDGYDWALFGYEAKSVDLKVDSIGSGGIESVAEEMNEGKIQYAFVRVHDPNTNLVKFLLINFQGESVLDLVHKGTCSNHIRDISKLLKNHLTITVTNTDDLDQDLISKKLSKITSVYNFQDRVVPNDEKIVIGTNYSKVIPNREIDSSKRDEFWKKEEEIEKARIASEGEAKRLENLKIEEERLKREQKEHLKREQMNLEVKKLALAPEIKPIPSPVVASVERDESQRPRAEEMRTERRKEAQELIGNKVNAAKMMFQQQAAQSTIPPKAVGPPVKPIRKTINKIEPEINTTSIALVDEPESANQSTELEHIVEDLAKTIVHPHQQKFKEEEEEQEQFSTIKRSPKTPTTPEIENGNNNGFIGGVVDNNSIQNDNIHVVEQQKEEDHQISVAYEGQQTDESPETPMLKAVALYDYQQVDDTEISFDPGDLITHIDQIDAGWWQGYSVRFGIYGLFPANYVQLVDDDNQTQ